ncbi:hypothetical protein [Floccifex sp.]|uniref:hypothetical protein n=1 Tax=Floccifex sp. TaxID=2815810 RepID=UPI003F0AA4BD
MLEKIVYETYEKTMRSLKSYEFNNRSRILQECKKSIDKIVDYYTENDFTVLVQYTKDIEK